MNPGTSPSAANLHGVARAGRLADSVLIAVRRHAAPGHAVGDLDRLASELLARHGADSAMLGHEDGFGGGRFPASIAVCINDEIMGASGPDRVLNPGDLITADLAVRCRGWHADAASTWTLPGPTPPEHARLAKAARAACVAGVRAARPGVPWSAITDAIQAAAEQAGAVLIPGYDAHGIGGAMHQPPRLPMHPSDLARLDPPGWSPHPGAIVTIEPVVGTRNSGVVRAGWLDRTADRSPACFVEATIAVGVRRNLVLAGRCWLPGWNDLRPGGA